MPPKLSWKEALAIILTIVSGMFFLGGQLSELQTIAKHNTASLDRIHAFIKGHDEEKRFVFERIATIQTLMKYYHSDKPRCKE